MTNQNDSLKKIEEFYFTIGNLPNTFPAQIRKLSSEFNPNGAYEEFNFSIKATSEPYAKGLWGRIDLWKNKILPSYDSLKLEELSKQEGLKTKCVNRFYQSRIRVEDLLHNKIYLDIWTPKFSLIFSYILGNKVKARLKRLK